MILNFLCTIILLFERELSVSSFFFQLERSVVDILWVVNKALQDMGFGSVGDVAPPKIFVFKGRANSPSEPPNGKNQCD